MAEVLRMTLVVLAVGASGTLLAYLLVFVAAAVWTLRSASRPDPLAVELDDMLAEELDRLLSEVLGPAGTAGVDR